MFSVNTSRLTIIPLSAELLLSLTGDRSALENELVCQYRGEAFSPEALAFLRAQCDVIQQDPTNWRWLTLWLILRNEDRLVVGSFAFKNIPEDEGSVEIGYGLAKEFFHHGYMTETVRAMCRWAKLQLGIHQITAKTEFNNIASKKVLHNCGFIESENGNDWTLDV